MEPRREPSGIPLRLIRCGDGGLLWDGAAERAHACQMGGCAMRLCVSPPPEMSAGGVPAGTLWWSWVLMTSPELEDPPSPPCPSPPPPRGPIGPISSDGRTVTDIGPTVLIRTAMFGGWGRGGRGRLPLTCPLSSAGSRKKIVRRTDFSGMHRQPRHEGPTPVRGGGQVGGRTDGRKTDWPQFHLLSSRRRLFVGASFCLFLILFPFFFYEISGQTRRHSLRAYAS